MKELFILFLVLLTFKANSQPDHQFDGADNFGGLIYRTGAVNIAGNVGIGTTAPQGKLHVVGNTILGGTMGDFIFTYAWMTGEHFMAIAPNASGAGSTDWKWDRELRLDGLSGELIKNTPTTSNIAFSVQTNGVKNLKIFGDGSIVIGNVNNPAGYKLYVKDGILTEKLKVALSTDSGSWSDYVFDDNYILKPLCEVEEFIKINRHLDGMPSNKELYESGGVDVLQMLKLQQEKIEELTLYIIQLNNRIKLNGK